MRKSTRHKKIIGDFGESLVCNWMSRSGFEVSIVDHTGLDIIAYYPSTGERLGITVKARTRNPGTETRDVTIFKKGDRKKLSDACQAFGCTPWIAVYVETEDSGDIYLASLQNYDDRYRGRQVLTGSWKMDDKLRSRYQMDPHVRHVGIKFTPENWWSTD